MDALVSCFFSRNDREEFGPQVERILDALTDENFIEFSSGVRLELSRVDSQSGYVIRGRKQRHENGCSVSRREAANILRDPYADFSLVVNPELWGA